MGLETVETVRPLGARDAEPVVHGEQAVELKSRRATLAVAAPIDEAGPLEHLQMLGDGRLSQRGGRRELNNASFAGRESLEDRSASGVGKRRESPAQGILSNHYL